MRNTDEHVQQQVVARKSVTARTAARQSEFDRLAADFLRPLNSCKNSAPHGGERRFSLTDPLVTLAMMVMDGIVIASTSLAASYAHSWAIGATHVSGGPFVSSALLLAAIFLLRGLAETIYGPLWGVSRHGAVRKTLAQYTQAFLVFVTALVMLKWPVSPARGNLVMQYVFCGAAVMALRALQYQLVHQGVLRRFIVSNRVILVGTAANIEAARQNWEASGENVEILKSFPMLLNESAQVSPDYLDAFARIVIQLSRAAKPDRIVILLPAGRSKEVRFLVERFADIPASILVSAEQLAGPQLKPEVLQFGSMHVLRVVRKPLTATDRILKRGMDFTAAALLLLLLSPLLIATAIAIRLESSGPALFRQNRKGFNQKQFSIYKFRTMRVAPQGLAFQQTAKNDQRITAIGKHLRRLNIDELPQLINVLRGEMSLVGPRPHAIEHDNIYYSEIASYARRHNIKPGITGLAQALGFRGATETHKQMEDRVTYDLLYMQNWSVFLDLKIMMMTVFSPRAYRNAY